MRVVLMAAMLCLLGALGGAQAQTSPGPAGMELAITVLDQNQRPIPGMQVSVAHKAWVGTHDPDYRAVTDAQGKAILRVQPGRYSGEQTFGTILYIDITDELEGKTNRYRNFHAEERVHYGAPISRTFIMLPASESVDTERGIPVRVNVVDEEGTPIPGVRVTAKTREMSQPQERLTDAQGYALLEVTVQNAGDVQITASKANFSDGKAREWLDPAMRRRGTVADLELAIASLRAADMQAQIRVAVSNANDKAPVADARVRFLPLDAAGLSFSGITGRDGVALLANNARGRFRLEVTQDYFLPGGQAEVTLERKNVTLPVALEEKAKKEGDSKVEVTVVAADKRDRQGRPLPIAGALVKAGNLGSPTDEDGKATLAFTGQLGVTLSIEAPDYKPQSVSVPGGRYLTGNHTRTVRLEPADANEATPVQLTVRVVDSAGVDQPVAAAQVKLVFGDGRSSTLNTQKNGEAEFLFEGEIASAVRRGVTAVVSASDYSPSSTQVPPLLEPSKETRYYLVNLDNTATRAITQDLDALAGEVARLERFKADIAAEERTADVQFEKASDALKAAEETALLWQGWVTTTSGSSPGKGPFLQFDGAQAKDFCKTATDDALRYQRSAATLFQDASQLIAEAQDKIDRCEITPSPELAADSVNTYRRAVARLGTMSYEAGAAAVRRDEVLKQLERADEEFSATFLDPLKQASANADAASREATRISDGLKPKFLQLAEGRTRAAARLAALRTRKLQPGHYPIVNALARRIEALDMVASGTRERAERRASSTADLLKRVGVSVAAYGDDGCQAARDLYRRAAAQLRANTDAVQREVGRHSTTLAPRAERCRAAAIAAAAQRAQPLIPAPSALVQVPDLSSVVLMNLAGVLQARGLADGPIQWVGPTPSPGQAMGIVGQSHPPGSMVPRGTVVTVAVWDVYKPPTGPHTPPPLPVAPPNYPQAPPYPQVPQPPVSPSGVYPPLANTPPPNYPAPAQPNRFAQGTGVTPPAPAPGVTGGVPNVIGESLEMAVSRLRAAGLDVGAVERGTVPPRPDLAGRVYYQSPVANSPFPANRMVALKQYGSMPATATAAPAPAGDGACLNAEGPLRCTGRFIGRYQMTCLRQGYPNIQEGGPAAVVLARDGSIEFVVARPGDTPFTMKGQIDAAGAVRVLINEPGDRREWVARFSVAAAAQPGVRTLTGRGDFNSTTLISGLPPLQCKGTYSLP